MAYLSGVVQFRRQSGRIYPSKTRLL